MNQDYETAKGNFWFLMECIEEYWTKENSPQNGQLYFIQDSWVAELVVSKYRRAGMEYFKAFFCNVVLRLHGEFGEELNIREYESYFGNRNGKKFAIDVEQMNYFMDFKAKETTGGLVYPLLERLHEVTYECLKEYFLTDDTDVQAKEKIAENRVKNRRIKKFTKEEKYCRFVLAACLYEIFISKFYGESTELFHKAHAVVNDLLDCMEAYKNDTECIKKQAEEGNPEEVIASLKKVINLQKTELELLEKLRFNVENVMLYISHVNHIMTFGAIISLIESFNINNSEVLPRKIKNDSIVTTLGVLFEKEFPYLCMDEIVMNKNASRLYQNFMDTLAREQLMRELCSSSLRTQRKAARLIQLYFEKVRDGEYENADFMSVVNEIAKKCLEKKEDGNEVK